MRRRLAITALLLVLQGSWGGFNPRCNCERHPRSRRRLSSEGEVLSYAKATPSVLRDNLPTEFDWSNVAGTNYLVPSWNQHIPIYCGSCYAHGSLNSVQDRIKVAKGAQAPDVTLARQSFLNCGPAKGFGNGCGGGDPADVFGFMHVVGLPDESCNNYVADTTPECTPESMCKNCMVLDDKGTKECWAVEPFTTYRVREYGELQGEEAIMAEIFERGPVVCGFISDEAFDYGYRGGVWTAKSEAQDIDSINHDVEVTGWGVTADGIKFWQARNSWGTYWGEGGFFKFERGSDLNRFESECYFAVVDTTGEAAVANGQLTGSMYGLVTKPAAAAQQSLEFQRAVAAVDWLNSTTPWPMGLPSNPHRRSVQQAQQNDSSIEHTIVEVVGANNAGAAIGGAVAGALLTFSLMLLVARFREQRVGYQNIEGLP